MMAFFIYKPTKPPFIDTNLKQRYKGELCILLPICNAHLESVNRAGKNNRARGSATYNRFISTRGIQLHRL